MYEYVKTGCKHIPPSEQPLQFQSGYYLNKPHTQKNTSFCMTLTLLFQKTDMGSTSKVVLVGTASVMGNYVQCLCPENITKKELNIYLQGQCKTKSCIKNLFILRRH